MQIRGTLRSNTLISPSVPQHALLLEIFHATRQKILIFSKEHKASMKHQRQPSKTTKQKQRIRHHFMRIEMEAKIAGGSQCPNFSSSLI